MKNLNLPIFILVILITFTAINTASATDIDFSLHRSYMTGFEDGTFRPNELVTREQALYVLAGYARMSPPLAMDIGSVFPDVEKSRWSYGSMESLLRWGVLDTLFPKSIQSESGGMTLPISQNIQPTKPLTRGELVSILYAGTGDSDMEIFYAEHNNEIKPVDFIDIKGHRFETAIKDIAGKGILNGYNDGSFKPDKNLTRAEFTSIMNTFLNRCTEIGAESNLNIFSDISEKDWFYKDILEATVNHGYKEINDKDTWVKPVTEEEMLEIDPFGFMR